MGSVCEAYPHKESPPRRAIRPDALIADLAAKQHGVVAVWQLLERGVPRHAVAERAAARRLHRLHRGVYSVGHAALSLEGRELAAVLACGPEALLSHRSAAARWGFLRSSSPRIEVTAPRGRHVRDGIVVHRTRLLHPDDVASVDGIPVTSVARTLVDVADVVGERRLPDAIAETERLALFDLTAVEAVLQRQPGRRGARALKRALAAYTPEPRFIRSPAEARLLAICRDQGLPLPQTNLWIAGYELDCYWPDARLAVEVDSHAHHTTTRAYGEDRRRDRALAAAGIQVVRVTWDDLADRRRSARS